MARPHLYGVSKEVVGGLPRFPHDNEKKPRSHNVCTTIAFSSIYALLVICTLHRLYLGSPPSSVIAGRRFLYYCSTLLAQSKPLKWEFGRAGGGRDPSATYANEIIK